MRRDSLGLNAETAICKYKTSQSYKTIIEAVVLVYFSLRYFTPVKYRLWVNILI